MGSYSKIQFSANMQLHAPIQKIEKFDSLKITFYVYTIILLTFRSRFWSVVVYIKFSFLSLLSFFPLLYDKVLCYIIFIAQPWVTTIMITTDETSNPWNTVSRTELQMRYLLLLCIEDIISKSAPSISLLALVKYLMCFVMQVMFKLWKFVNVRPVKIHNIAS